MRWKIEYITPDSTNILVDDPNVTDMDKVAVVIGRTRIHVDETIVNMHNEALEPKIDVKNISEANDFNEPC